MPCPIVIAQLEQRVAELRAVVNEPAFYQRPHGEVQQSLDELHAAEQRGRSRRRSVGASSRSKPLRPRPSSDAS